MIPTELKMDDLSGLAKLQPTLVLNLVFAKGDREISRRTALNRRVFIRLLDKAVDEYEESRNLIVAQIAEGEQSTDEMARSGRHIYMFKFVDHMENCISTVRRILRFLDILKGNRDGLAFPRTVRKHIESLTTPIVEVRDTVEHMDERIHRDEIGQDEPVMLKVTDSQDGVMIGGQSLRFSTLSALIRQLHSLGESMAAWRAADDSDG
ncbi:MAG: hypothetical protein ABIL06_12050 [Pseudomonadota bacterium]